MSGHRTHSGKGKDGGSAGGTPTGYQFVNITLGRDDKAWLREADLPNLWGPSVLFGLVAEGYKVSFNEDREHSSFVCSLTDTREGSACYKCILTGRGPDPESAWFSVCYKHFQLTEGDWLSFAADGGDDFR